MKKTRILHFGCTVNAGGVEVFVKNVILNSSIPMDIVVSSEAKFAFEDEIKEHGSRVLRIPPRKKNPFAYRKNIAKLLKQHPEYSIVHVHLQTASSIEPVVEAKKLGLKCVVHSHSTSMNWGSCINKVLHCIHIKKLNRLADVKLSCSQDAGKFMFKDNFIIIKNSIDINKFTFNPSWRKEIRQEFGIKEDSFVILHVGMFSEIKNQTFLVNCLPEIVRKNANTILILVGEGAEKEKVMEKTKKLGVVDNVIFAGKRMDTNKFYSAADIFVLPSLFEGLGITLLEAQVSSLDSIASSNVPKEVNISGKVNYVPLIEQQWVDTISKSMQSYERKYVGDDFINAGLSISQTVNEIEKIYDML